jgi:hypothetical protein
MKKNKIKFESCINLINTEILKRKNKWTLSTLNWIDFEDVSQIIRFHIYKKWELYDENKPMLPWVNRIISNQIKNLIRNNEGTKFIYMPNQMFSQLEAPSFINFFANHQDSIIVIEDAEALLTERKEGNTSISTLLNLTDGMLGEALRIKVICTFNCDISQIDSALKRKGRLKFSYDFKELSLDKTNKLLKKVGHEHTSEEPMVLTDIINFDVDQYEKEDKPMIGFNNRK